MKKKFLGVIFVFIFPGYKMLALPVSNPGDSLSQINWIQLDPVDDSTAGISLIKAYQLLQGRPSMPVIVGVIDTGVDTTQEDLQGHIWTNKGEIPGNGIDDDGNGYADDIHGWNFQGGPDGDVVDDTYELTREYARLSKKYEDVPDGKSKEYKYWLKIKSDYEEADSEAVSEYNNYKDLVHDIPRYFSLVKNYLDVDTLRLEDLAGVKSEDSVVNEALSIVKRLVSYFGSNTSVNSIVGSITKNMDYFKYQAETGYNTNFDPRKIVGDNYNDPYQRYYGNNHCGYIPEGTHGTHVSGIIGAGRDNELGINGIADNVKVLAVRAVPNGDERDKDVANAIYYAVNNGARVINMSFGKDYSPDREAVEKAVKYAEKKGVLLIHAAGNDGKNIDSASNFPTKKYIKGKKEAWNIIEVGASSKNLDESLTAYFSNYGKERVDLFAPGVKVWSTMPDQKFKASSGTSMAAPVVTGVVALLMEYFPELSSREIRDIIVNSTWDYKGDVYRPGSKDKVKLNDLCSSGGVVNAYNAVKMALNAARIQNR
jgi:cell wall-associated protease